jgi:hypothetical protein
MTALWMNPQATRQTELYVSIYPQSPEEVLDEPLAKCLGALLPCPVE